MKHRHIIGALTVFVLSFVVDRITKIWAVHNCSTPWHINRYMSCELVFNRGVSWSFFSFADDMRFILLTAFLTLITLILGIYAWRNYKEGESIYGELLVISGSLSNIVDRILYNGVVDFIILSYGSFSWPVFNVADVCIVTGVGLMILKLYKKN